MADITKYVLNRFGVAIDLFIKALELSPGAQGYIAGAVSELLLKQQLEDLGYEVIRIKEKPSGGNTAKSGEARGDFYVRKRGSKKDEWLVIESKGLKSNSEFRGSKLSTKDQVFKFLRKRVFDTNKQAAYEAGERRYNSAKAKWEAKNAGKSFPAFRWNKSSPGAEIYDLSGIWDTEDALEKWVDNIEEKRLTEDAYRQVKGAIAILETHQPSKRVDPATGIDQAAPLVSDFNIMSVDLFLRTGKHEFVFMNSDQISHSPTSPNHLYQNYTIDMLIPGVKDEPVIQLPWYRDFEQCVRDTSPKYRSIDRSQVDYRVSE